MSFPSGTNPTFIYNGFQFGGATRSQVRGKPLYDGADRAVVAMVYTLDAVTIIAESVSGTTDSEMDDAMNRLSKPGQSLVYADSGGGSFRINVGSVRDVMWGPKPRVLNIRPLGNQRAWEIVWQCEVAIPKCTNAVYSGAVMAFNYEVDYKIDNDGYTTRVISGYLEIPMTRIGGGRAMPDTADSYYEQAVPTIPAGFMRKDKTRHLSADKRKLDFSFTDEQIPGGTFPLSITDFEGSHRVATAPMNWVKFDSTISATYTVPAGVPRTKAADAFYALLLDRARVSKDKGRIFVSFDATEGLGRNRKIAFNCSWWNLSTVADCMADAGFWRPLPGVTWAQWQASAGVNNARGSAGLVHSAADDAIVDLCIGDLQENVLRSRQRDNRLVSRQRPPTDTRLRTNPAATWLLYRLKLIVEQIPSISRLKYLPKTTPTIPGMGEAPLRSTSNGSGSSGNPGFFGRATAQILAMASQTSNGAIGAVAGAGVGFLKDTIYHRAPPSYRAILEGYAVRSEFGIPNPRLVTVGRVVPVPSKQWTTGDTLIANFGGIAVYYKGFRFEYELSEAPDRVLVPPNAELMLQR